MSLRRFTVRASRRRSTLITLVILLVRWRRRVVLRRGVKMNMRVTRRRTFLTVRRSRGRRVKVRRLLRSIMFLIKRSLRTLRIWFVLLILLLRGWSFIMCRRLLLSMYFIIITFGSTRRVRSRMLVVRRPRISASIRRLIILVPLVVRRISKIRCRILFVRRRSMIASRRRPLAARKRRLTLSRRVRLIMIGRFTRSLPISLARSRSMVRMLITVFTRIVHRIRRRLFSSRRRSWRFPWSTRFARWRIRSTLTMFVARWQIRLLFRFSARWRRIRGTRLRTLLLTRMSPFRKRRVFPRIRSPSLRLLVIRAPIRWRRRRWR